jgi:hypothetical protein
MSYYEIFVVSMLTLTLPVSFCCCFIIWSYLSHKPLGMQTLLDTMIKELALSKCAYLTVSTLSIIIVSFLTPLNHYVALGISLTVMFLSLQHSIQILLTMLTRLVSIFYAPHLADLDEDRFVTFCTIDTGCPITNGSLFQSSKAHSL